MGHNNGWLYFIATEIQVYLLCKNIINHSYDKGKIQDLIHWIMDDSEFQLYIFNVFGILIEFFEDESKDYFFRNIRPFIEQMKELSGTEQLAFGLFSLYTIQEMSNEKEVTSTINDWVLLRFLEMLGVQFMEVITDLSYEVFQKVATSKSETAYLIDYEHCLMHSENLAPILNESVEQIIKDDMIKIENFFEQYF